MTLPNSIQVTEAAMNQAAIRLFGSGGEIYYCLDGNLNKQSSILDVQANEVMILGYTRPEFTLGVSNYDPTDVRWEANLDLSSDGFMPQETGSFDQVVVVLADDTVYSIATWDSPQSITVGVEFKFFDVLKMTYGNQGAIVNINDS